MHVTGINTAIDRSHYCISSRSYNSFIQKGEKVVLQGAILSLIGMVIAGVIVAEIIIRLIGKGDK